MLLVREIHISVTQLEDDNRLNILDESMVAIILFQQKQIEAGESIFFLQIMPVLIGPVGYAMQYGQGVKFRVGK